MGEVPVSKKTILLKQKGHNFSFEAFGAVILMAKMATCVLESCALYWGLVERPEGKAVGLGRSGGWRSLWFSPGRVRAS